MNTLESKLFGRGAETEEIETEIDETEAAAEEQEVDESEDDDFVAAAAEEAEEEEIVQPEITNEKFFEFFEKQTGRKINSFDELKPEVKIVEDYANDEVKTINKFVKETNRSAADWYKMQSLDIEAMSVEDKVKQKMAMENPNLSAREVNLLYNRKFKKTEIDESSYLSEAERNKIVDDNEYVDILLKQESAAADKLLRELKQSYALPARQEQESNFKPEEFQAAWKETANKIEALEYGLDSKAKFTWSINENERKFFESPVEPDKFLAEYINKDGSWNMERWAADMYTLKNHERILRGAAAAKTAKHVEEIVDTITAADKMKPTSKGGVKAKGLTLGQFMMGKR